MVPHSQTDLSPHRREILDAQLRESFGRVVYAHKAHEKEAELLLTRLSTTKIGQIALSALSTGGFIATLFGTGWWGSLVGAVCSAMLLAVNLYSRSHDLGKLAQQHRDAAIEIWYIREQYSSLITDLAIGSASLTAIQDKRDILVDELKIVYAKCPNTSNKSYRIAHKALNFREEMTFSVDEVDSFLPTALRRSE